MKKEEYYKLQKALSDHLERVLHCTSIRRKEQEVYERAVKACKSVLSVCCNKEWENENA